MRAALTRRAPTSAGAHALAIALFLACINSVTTGCAAPPQAVSVSAPSQPALPGLELRRWFVPIDAALRSTALETAQTKGVLIPVTTGLSDAGFSMYRCSSGQLTQLMELLGGSPQVRSTAMGTLANWADMETLRLSGERTVFYAGRPKTLSESMLRLSLRGWCFPTVDSARARIEVRLTTETVRTERASLDPTATRTRARDLGGGRTVVELAPDEVLIVLETPVVVPDDAPLDGLAAPAPPSIAALALAERPIAGRATVLIVAASMADMLPPNAQLPTTPHE